MPISVRNLPVALLIIGYANHCMADMPIQPSMLYCYSSLQEYFGKNMSTWNVNQFNENPAYTSLQNKRTYNYDGSNIIPTYYFYKSDDGRQCLIFYIGFAADIENEFSPNGTLIQVIAREPVTAQDTDPRKEIVFKSSKSGSMFPSECKLKFSMGPISINYPCGEMTTIGPTASLRVPSFDCKKAQSRIEKLVCKDANLSTLDTALDVNYKHILSSFGDDEESAPVVAEQKAWLKQRNTCKDQECLIEMYLNRLDGLCSTYNDSFEISSSGDRYFCITYKH